MTREEAIRAIGWLKCTTNREDDLEAIDMAIEALSADAVQGEWIRHELFGNPWFTCSECNYHGRNDFNFCPNCGARMYKGGAE